jgi:general secretion pathway protein D
LLEGTGTFVGKASRQISADDDENGVTVNLVNVQAQLAAKTILGDIFGVKYTINPSIDGRITIQTPNPVPKSTVIDLFKSALRSNNAAIVNASGTYKIVPVDLAPVGAIPQTGDPPDPGGRLGSSVQVVQLKYVAAAEIRRILEPIEAPTSPPSVASIGRASPAQTIARRRSPPAAD